MKKANFAMAFHCYQPVFNFDWEIENAYKNAYLPLVKVFKKHPEIKTSFHFSGNLLEWIESKHPEYIEIIKSLLWKGQIEIIGGGCFEPVMTLIPERDRRQQLEMNNEVIARIFGIKPQGVWLTERVWDPSLADTFSGCGIKYTIVDDLHILRTGIDAGSIHKPYSTCGSEGEVILFPSLTSLRYAMPFRMPEVTLEYMKNALEKTEESHLCFFFADDGEKFGAWPYTYNWVYKKGWLDNFLELLEDNSSWLKTSTYSEIAGSVSAHRVDNVPQSSYPEMMKWSGGNFNNFLKKYPEANRMHKRMMSVSSLINSVEDKEENESIESKSKILEAKRELFKAQSNCAYWHGAFGGVYLPHLRAGVYKHIIKAQDIIQKKTDGISVKSREEEDHFQEKRREIILENRSLNIFVDPEKGAGISELDYKPLHLNLVNTFSRVKEDYHRKLNKTYSTKIKEARKLAQDGEVTNIHDILGVKETGLKKILSYDDYPRFSFLTHVFKENKPLQDTVKTRESDDNILKGRYFCHVDEDQEYVQSLFSKRSKVFIDNSSAVDLNIKKEIIVGHVPAIMLKHRIDSHSTLIRDINYAVEFNFHIWDKNVIARPKFFEGDKFSLVDKHFDLALDFFLDKSFEIFMYPVYSINETEKGLVKTFQGVSVLIGGKIKQTDRNSEMMVTIAVG